MMSKAIATIGVGRMQSLLDLGLQTLRPYADRHGYDLVIGGGAYAEGRPLAWAKVGLLRHLLGVYDLVVWIDADAIVVDLSSDIADDLPADAFQAMVSTDGGPLIGPSPNAGVWVLRACDRAHQFLNEVWNSVEYIDHKLWDNAAVLHLLGYTVEPEYRRVRDSEWARGTHFLNEEWNSIHVYRRLKPARIRHYAGEDHELRLRRMRAEAWRVHGARWRPAISDLYETQRYLSPPIRKRSKRALVRYLKRIGIRRPARFR